MAHQDVIRMAREAGLLPNPEVYVEDLERFAVLVAAAGRKPLPLKTVEMLIYENTKLNPNVADDRELLGYIINTVRAVEQAHGIGDNT